MAFATGHTAPAGFAAGQLADGASIGTFRIKNAHPTAGGGTVEVFIRAYGGKNVVLTEYRNATSGMVESKRVKQADFLTNVNNDVLAAPSDVLRNLVPLVANAAQLVAIGVQDNGQVPGTASGKLSLTQNADGVVSAYTGTGAVTPQGAVGVYPDKPGSPSPAGKFLATNKKKIIIVLAVIAVAVAGYFAYEKYGKKKGHGAGKPHSHPHRIRR